MGCLWDSLGRVLENRGLGLLGLPQHHRQSGEDEDNEEEGCLHLLAALLPLTAQGKDMEMIFTLPSVSPWDELISLQAEEQNQVFNSQQ